MFGLNFVNHRTHILCTAVLGSLASVFAGCVIGDDDDDYYYEDLAGYYENPPSHRDGRRARRPRRGRGPVV